MLLKELTNIELTAHVSGGFITQWSNDNHIVVVTQHGIYSFQYFGSMETHETTFSFRRDLITPNSYYPSLRGIVNLNSFFDSLPREYFYEGVLDQNISADLRYIQNKEFFFNYASWSPPGILDRTYSVLATINNYGAVELLLYCKRRWVYISKVTDAVLEEASSKWQDITAYPSKHKYPIYQKRIYDIATSSLTWSSMYDDFCILILGHISGKITFWTMLKEPTYPENYINLTHLAMFNEFEKRITALHWIPLGLKALLIMGTLNGEVRSLKVDLISKGKLDFGAVNKIWPHLDLIRVSHIASLILNGKIYILIVKGAFIICMNIDAFGCVLCKSHIDLGNFNVTGLQQFSKDTFAALTQTGAIFLTKIEPSGKKLKFRATRIKHSLKVVEHTFHGMFSSPNGVFWGIVSFPCSMRTYRTKGLDMVKIHFCLNENKHPASIVTNNPLSSLCKFWDCLDVMRCTSMKKREMPSVWLKDDVDPDTLSLYKLKIYLWMSTACNFYIKHIGSSIMKNTLPSAAKLREVIMLKTARNRAKYLLNKYNATSKLRGTDWLSLRIIRDSLEYFRDKSENSSKWKNFVGMQIDPLLMELVNVDQIQTVSVPKCSFCGEEPTGIKCKTAHPDQRCCISLLQIDALPTFYCPRCDCTVHESIEPEMLICPFCDIPLVSNFFGEFQWEIDQEEIRRKKAKSAAKPVKKEEVND